MRRPSTGGSRSKRQPPASRTPAPKGSSLASDGGWLVWALLIFFLLLGAALRLYQLDAKSFWYDELGTALYTAPAKSLLDVVRSPRQVPVIPAPPLYFLTIYLFRHVSESEFLLRLPSVFYGLLTIAAFYPLGRALLGRREGLVGVFLLAISPFHIRYSQEARSYTLLLLLATLSLYFFYQGLRRNDRLSWVGYVVSTILALYTHVFAFLFLAAEGIYGIMYFAWRRFRNRGSALGEGSKPWRGRGPFFSFLLSALVMALLYVPMLPQTLSGLLGYRGLGGSIHPAFERDSLSYLAGIVDLLGAGPGVALVCYLLALGLGLYFLGRRAHGQLLLAVLWITLPFLVVFLVRAGHHFRLRYVIFVQLLLLLIVSAGLVGMGDVASSWLARWLPKRSTAQVVGPVTFSMACMLFSVFSHKALQSYWSEEKQPWDKAVAFLQRVVGPDDVVITTNESHAQRLVYYGYDASEVEYLVPCPCPAKVHRKDWLRFPELASPYDQAWLFDLNSIYQHLRPGGAYAERMPSYSFLPPIVFKGRTNGSAVEMDLLGPYITSDVSVLPALPRDSQLSDEQIVEVGSTLTSHAEELYPGGTRLQFTLAQLYQSYGSEDEAISHYKAAIATDPRYYPGYEELASIYVRQGEIQKAMELYRMLSKMDIPHGSYYHFLLGNLHIMEGDVGAALAELRLAVRMDARNLDYRMGLGDAYRDAGRWGEALGQYDEITRLDPSYAMAYAHRGSIYHSQGRLAQATTEYQIAVHLRPRDALYRAELAEVYREQGLLDKALAEAREAVRLQNDQAAYHVLLGEVYRTEGRLREAISEFEVGVQLAPTVVPYQLNLAAAYLRADRREEAVATYERVLELDPGNATATRSLQELR